MRMRVKTLRLADPRHRAALSRGFRRRSRGNRSKVVKPAAIQFADGRIDDGQIMAPSITVGGADHTEWGLNSDQARELAAVLLGQRAGQVRCEVTGDTSSVRHRSAPMCAHPCGAGRRDQSARMDQPAASPARVRPRIDSPNAPPRQEGSANANHDNPLLPQRRAAHRRRRRL